MLEQVETHPFEPYYNDDSRILIIGSFPCKHNGSYGDWYYRGSGKNYFWELLGKVYGMDFEKKEDQIKICEDNNIAIVDVFLKIKRKKKSCSDSNLEMVEYNKKAIENILKLEIQKVLFTSQFAKKQFDKLFKGRDDIPPSYALPSPSRLANIPISKSDVYKKLEVKDFIKNPFDYRLLKYIEYLLD